MIERRRWFSPLPWLVLALPALLPAQTPPPPFDAKATVSSVAEMLQEDHLLQAPLDRARSERAFAALIQAEDPLGLYFYQADVDALEREVDRLGGELLAGDDRFAFAVQKVFAERVVAGVELGCKWLERPHDFTVDESMRVDIGLREYAPTPEVLDDRWRQRVKHDLLVLRADGMAMPEAVTKLRKRYERMAERVTLRTPEATDDLLLDAFANSYDPHTSYLPPRAATDFTIHIRLNYEGIGAVLRDEDGRAVVGSLMDGGAAAASGELHPGDVIEGVGQGDDGEIDSVHGLELDEVVDKIRGPRDSVVRLAIAGGEAGQRIVRLQRRRTELVDQRATGKVVTEGEARIGWIDLPGFYGDRRSAHSASRDVAELLRGFDDAKVDAVVLDLRRNGGGLLDEGVKLTGLFLDTGNVVQVQGSNGKVRRLDDDEPGAIYTGPLVVLISRFSASASEIVAGAIVDQGRGIVVGDTSTHGKGTVQAMIDLASRGPHDGATGALKLTIQQFFRPGGDSTQRRGVAADVVLPSWSEAVGEGEGALPNALPFRHIESAVSSPLSLRDPREIAALAAASAARCAADEQFQAVVVSNRRRLQWREQKAVPLQEAAYQAYRQDQNQAREEAAGKQEAPWYVAEVCRIAGDYGKALRARRPI